MAPVGDRGRLVLPAQLRESQSWEQGTPLLFVETPRGVVVTTQRQALDLLREQLGGEDSLVDELLAERRRAAELEDAECSS